MSGRTRHLRDGAWITNRKTDRRTPRRDPAERRQAIIRAALAPAGDKIQVGMAFRLPQWLEGLVAIGPFGIGITIRPEYFVLILGNSSEHCERLAKDFFATTARDRAGFTAGASYLGNVAPDHPYGRWLVVTNGSMVVCAGEPVPRIYEAAAA
jgi:hypothetical protein